MGLDFLQVAQEQQPPRKSTEADKTWLTTQNQTKQFKILLYYLTRWEYPCFCGERRGLWFVKEPIVYRLSIVLAVKTINQLINQVIDMSIN